MCTSETEPRIKVNFWAIFFKVNRENCIIYLFPYPVEYSPGFLRRNQKF